MMIMIIILYPECECGVKIQCHLVRSMSVRETVLFVVLHIHKETVSRSVLDTYWHAFSCYIDIRDALRVLLLLLI